MVQYFTHTHVQPTDHTTHYNIPIEWRKSLWERGCERHICSCSRRGCVLRSLKFFRLFVRTECAHAEDQSQCRENHNPLNSALTHKQGWRHGKYAADGQPNWGWKQVCVHSLYLIRSNIPFLLSGLYAYMIYSRLFKQSHLYRLLLLASTS